MTDHYFLDFYHDLMMHAIVGLLTKDAATCQGLVDIKTGRPVSTTSNNTKSRTTSSVEYVSCSDLYGGYKKNMATN